MNIKTLAALQAVPVELQDTHRKLVSGTPLDTTVGVVLESKAAVGEKEVQYTIAAILADRASYTKSLNWAVNYCRYAQHMRGEELKVQCLYILNNIQKWRHPEAKEVRTVLKKFAGIK